MSHGGRWETQFTSCFQVTGTIQKLPSMEVETRKISWSLRVQASFGLYFSSEGCMAKRITYIVPCIWMHVVWLCVYIIPWERNNFYKILHICSFCLEQKLWLKVKKKDKGSAPEQKIACTFSIHIDEIIPYFTYDIILNTSQKYMNIEVLSTLISLWYYKYFIHFLIFCSRFQ